MTLDLNFLGHNTRYATHGLHSYSAKCPPQLVEYGLDHFSDPGDLILDPMVGSGTTLVEAKIHGRNSIGFDFDPLACLIARVKSSFIDDKSIQDALIYTISKTKEDIFSLEQNSNNISLLERSEPPTFPNRDYWFSEQVQKELALLGFHIENSSTDSKVREFLWVAFSGIILTKVSVANARDIIHSRHHYFEHEQVPNVLEKFEKRVNRMRKQMQEFGELCVASDTTAEVYKGDARSLPIESDTVDLVFTSPPYATALDYPRAHFLAVSWMERVLAVDHDQYKKRAETYIGTERGKVKDIVFQEKLVPSARKVIEQLLEIDRRKAHLIERYFHDMTNAISEMARVLRPAKHVVIVVCPSHIRKIEIPTHKVFTEIAFLSNMSLVAEHIRTIDSAKRVLPHVRGAFGNRMSTEYVLVFQKES